jgi:hypothetical protein
MGAALCTPRSSEAQSTQATIYVARRGWHIDVGFETVDIRQPLDSVMAGLDGAKYLFFGFGDKHYLLARNRRGSALLGALWPGPGMILVTALRASPDDAFGTGHVVALRVSMRGLLNMQAFVWRSLAGENASAQSFGTGPYPGGFYFAATPRYSAVHTCNTWAAETLRAAALPVHSNGVLLAGQVWRQVERLQRKQQSQNELSSRLHWQHDDLPSTRAISPSTPRLISPSTASLRPSTPRLISPSTASPRTCTPRLISPSTASLRPRTPTSLRSFREQPPSGYLQGGLVPSWQTTVVPEP